MRVVRRSRVGMVIGVWAIAGLMGVLAGCSSDAGSTVQTADPQQSTQQGNAESGTDQGSGASTGADSEDAQARSEVEEEAGSHAEEPAEEQTTPAQQSTPPAPLPDCEELLSIDQANAEMQVDTVQFWGQEDNVDRVLTGDIYGPAAVTAFSAATEMRSCLWAIPNSDGILHFNVATIPDTEREAFLAALRESDYVESEVLGEPSFELMVPGVGWGGVAGPVRFAFVGPYVYTSAGSTGGTMLARVVPALQ